MLASLLLALNLVLLGIYLFSSYKGYFHSDSAVKSLLAQDMHETSSFFPPGWNYVNKDLMVIFGQLGIWPLLFFAANTYTLYAISSVFVATCILASVWWFTGLLDGRSWQRVLSLAVLAGGMSATVAEDIFGQGSYGVVLMFTCLLAVMAWKSMSASGRPRMIWWGLFFLLLSLVSWSNPQRSAASYVLPLFCGLALHVWGPGWRSRVPASLQVAALTILGLGTGSVLSVVTLARVNSVAGAGAAKWLSFDGMVDNAAGTLQGMIGLLGGMPVANGDVLSAGGVYDALRLVVALVMIVLIGRKMVALCTSTSGRARFVGGLVAALALCFIFLQVTTTVPDMSDPIRSARYLDPAVVIGVMIVLSSISGAKTRVSGLLVVALALSLVTNSMVRASPDSLIYSGRTNIKRDALVAELRSMGLHYGYATYWNAGALTVLSGGDVKVRQVTIYGGLPIPMRHLSSDRWYEPEAWKGEVFLLLEDKDLAALDWGALTRYAGQPTRERKIDDKTVVVFAENLSARLPNWSGLLREPFRMFAGADGAHQVGRWNPAARALQAAAGETGYLQFGPYRPLSRGRYRVTFEVVGVSERADQVVGRVDVVASNGSKVFGTLDIRGDGTERHSFDFDVDETVSDLELRVWATGGGKVTYNAVTLSPRR